MKRLFVVAAITIVLVFIGWLLMQKNSHAPPNSLVFTFVPGSFTNGTPQTFSVVASNRSDFPLLCSFMGGFKGPWFQVAFLKNDVWYESNILSFGGSEGIISPHEAGRGKITVPEGATKLKVGLSITSLTWRGRASWDILRSRYGGIAKSFGDFLMAVDLKNRSETEWSDECIVSSNTMNAVQSGK